MAFAFSPTVGMTLFWSLCQAATQAWKVIDYSVILILIMRASWRNNAIALTVIDSTACVAHGIDQSGCVVTPTRVALCCLERLEIQIPVIRLCRSFGLWLVSDEARMDEDEGNQLSIWTRTKRRGHQLQLHLYSSPHKNNSAT